MNYEPKNGTFDTPLGKRAEVFFQSVNCDHIAEGYRKNLTEIGSQQQMHDVNFVDIVRLLRGNVLVKQVPKSAGKWKAISFDVERKTYYQTFFFLKNRTDCPTLFAVILSCYITHDPTNKEEYQAYIARIEVEKEHRRRSK